MPKGPHWTLALAVLLLAPFAGCTSATTFPTLLDVHRIQAIEAARQNAHDRNITDQHKLQTPKLANDLENLRNNFVQANKKLDEELKSLESSLAPVIEKVTALGLKLLGVPGSVTDLVKGESDQTKTGLQQKIDAVLKELETKSETLTARLASFEKTEAATIADLRKQLEENKLAKQLSDKDLTTLQQAVQTRGDEILALKNDPEKLRATVVAIARDAGLSGDAIKALQNADDGELLRMLMVLLGGGTLGGAASRLGSSRSKRDIEELRTNILSMKSEVTNRLRLEADLRTGHVGAQPPQASATTGAAKPAP